MADRNSTPYVAAVVEEIMRHCPMYYTNAAHSNLEEAEILMMEDEEVSGYLVRYQ